MSRLDPLIEATRERLAERIRATPLAGLEAAAAGLPEARPFAEALAGEGVSIIAEHKRRSPSAGAIREGSTVEDIVGAYEEAGAAALSVLTEERHFGGTLEDLAAARAASTLPILRKDFTVDRYQLYEARVAGADAILLIVGAIPIEELGELHAEARSIDLDVVVEVHDEEDLAQALKIDADVIGINNRDLVDFSVSLSTTYDLLPEIPAGITVVSESGISEREHVEELQRVGVDAILVGEALMRAPDPGAALAELLPHEAEDA
jgi:indole-3-glycerol phosphate synthase